MSKSKFVRPGCLYCVLLTVILGCLQPFEVEARSTDNDVVVVKDVPHVRQKPDFCGEACIVMYLQKLGHDVCQDAIFDLSGVDPALGRGCVTRDMVRVLRRIGFGPGAVWHKIDPRKSKHALEIQWNSLLLDLQNGTPSIVCMRYGSQPGAPEHFRLVLGYDRKADEVIYHEPAEDNGAYRRMKRAEFLDLWPLKYKQDEWLVIWMPLSVGRISLSKSGGDLTDADYAQHIMKVKRIAPAGFTIVLEPPFVVVGDEKPSVVRSRAERTVKWFVDHIRKLYFEKAPPKVYSIWLFKDNESYRRYAKELFNDEPDTPFGYCSDSNQALIMNIATGGGTLCHEIVHAFTTSNFPQCPAWFNEGLASLYEQCGPRAGRVVGLTNWRLAGLKTEIRAGTLPSFKTLLGTTTYRFYNMRRGNNYAQARYLCYYLQEKGLLVKFYDTFRRNVKNDPSGYETLKSIVSEDDMADFQQRWEKWVLRLRFP
ncbi:MAG: C39 family peptidase [Phycisphaerales bacterium]|nr:MAG: C39 family peptidase [Phycisphaerales bacterium]